MKNNLNTTTKRLDELYILAEENNIPIDEACPESLISMSLSFADGSKIIGISNDEASEYTRLERMAHEMGHCMTDSFYAGYSPFELRAKHENRANARAINKIIPFAELCDAVKEGCRELWELAEHFGVSQCFIEKAIKMHEQNGRIVPIEMYSDN